jgi:peptidoglycan-associated lipoprotein
VREDTTTRTGGGPGDGRSAPGTGQASPLKDVFFEYDRVTLTEEAKRDLDGNVTWLRANVQVRITVEGHCDERGTNEYNLALGDRRAKAVRDYLVAAGIDVRRIVTISYGEERPFNPGHDETAWRENRRAHFVVTR